MNGSGFYGYGWITDINIILKWCLCSDQNFSIWLIDETLIPVGTSYKTSEERQQTDLSGIYLYQVFTLKEYTARGEHTA